MKPGTILKDGSIYVAKFPDKTHLLCYEEDAPKLMDWWTAKKHQETFPKWMLPNKLQLNELYVHRKKIAGIQTRHVEGNFRLGYWSCEHVSGYEAWEQEFMEPGRQEESSKYVKLSVRLVRVVTQTELESLS
jgi:hypothetical protein